MESKRFVGSAVLVLSSLLTAGQAQVYTTVFSFDGVDGTNNGAPYNMGLIQASDGNFYGTTLQGGANPANGYGAGTIFRLTASGALTTLYSFCAQTNCTDGDSPYAGLVQATNGDLYGTTGYGGAYGYGTVFKITLHGMLTTLYSFCSQIVGGDECVDGSIPRASLIQATNGDLYGTTGYGGPNGGGTIFKITPSGTLTTLYTACAQSGCPDGELPLAQLVQASNGNFYGTMFGGGAYGYGTAFRMTPSGTLTTLHSFCYQGNYPSCADGALPYEGSLVQATNGDLYGITNYGGTTAAGTVFRITPGGTLTTLYTFGNRQEGYYPVGGLIQATDGYFYGTTQEGGANGYGTIFKMTPSGSKLTALYSFCSQGSYPDCTDGYNTLSTLLQTTNGDFYGITSNGGTIDNCYDNLGCGTVFSLSVGLSPFVKIYPITGTVGAVVYILGSDLTGASSVSFNGAAAAFTAVSPTLIIATAPAGATNGQVRVVTPTGTLSSNVPFRVRP